MEALVEGDMHRSKRTETVPPNPRPDSADNKRDETLRAPHSDSTYGNHKTSNLCERRASMVEGVEGAPETRCTL